AANTGVSESAKVVLGSLFIAFSTVSRGTFRIASGTCSGADRLIRSKAGFIFVLDSAALATNISPCEAAPGSRRFVWSPSRR
ncbi:MAG TPA: hypothetical protein VE087_06025, partial [Xanthobacteraceae bacterium]|nr:hypothetical protein [Xanthobacteraceae bacterium]